MMTRRGFFAAGTAAALTGCATGTKCGSGASGLANWGCGAPLGRKAVRYRLAMAGYTYHRFTLDETLAQLEQFGCHYLCVKDFHLPISAKPEQIREFRSKCADHGVFGYGVGPIYMMSLDEAKRAFDYAKALDAEVVVGVPGEHREGKGKAVFSSRRLCEEISGLCASYNLRYAIHNHGANPETGNPNLFPTPKFTYEMVKDLDPRMGLCVDIAYTYADGFDPAETVRLYRDRVFDCHVRGISDPKNGSSACNALESVLDLRPVFRALAEIGYTGCCGLENAAAFPNCPAWIPQSLGYYQGLIDSLDLCCRCGV